MILKAEQVKKADDYTIAAEPVKSVDLMERASQVFVNWLISKHPSKYYTLFCGLGNNGGDGLASARLLQEKNNINIALYLVGKAEKGSADFEINRKRLKDNGITYKLIKSVDDLDLPELRRDTIIIDALFGYGLNRPIDSEPYKSVIELINNSDKKVVSIDLPSGLFADCPSSGSIIKADDVLTFQWPKLALVLPQNSDYVQNFEVGPIGLQTKPEFSQTKFFYLDRKAAQQIRKPARKFEHKGSFGHALIIAGSDTKPGAAVLTSKAAIKSGAGLVTCHSVKSTAMDFLKKAPEIMLSFSQSEALIDSLPHLSPFNAIAVGPGIGRDAVVVKMLTQLIKQATFPLILDADALNIISENKTLIDQLPADSILTPHPKEFARLFGKFKNDFDRIEFLSETCRIKGLHILIKGAHTAIGLSSGDVWFNSTGNPGMATAGSGDVLTGCIAGLLARGYEPSDALRLAVYIHGLAGDHALERESVESLCAGSIIDHFGKAFNSLQI